MIPDCVLHCSLNKEPTERFLGVLIQTTDPMIGRGNVAPLSSPHLPSHFCIQAAWRRPVQDALVTTVMLYITGGGKQLESRGRAPCWDQCLKDLALECQGTGRCGRCCETRGGALLSCHEQAQAARNLHLPVYFTCYSDCFDVFCLCVCLLKCVICSPTPWGRVFFVQSNKPWLVWDCFEP